jgi:hypothetical protein
LSSGDAALSFKLNDERVAEAALDGLYVIRKRRLPSSSIQSSPKKQSV